MMLPCAGWPSRPCTIAVRQFSSCCSRPLSETDQCTTEQGVKGSSPLDKFLEIKRCFLVDWHGFSERLTDRSDLGDRESSHVSNNPRSVDAALYSCKKSCAAAARVSLPSPKRS